MTSEYSKTLLRNLYLLANHLGRQARFRESDLFKKEEAPHFHWKDKGNADAYESIVFHLQRPELLENLDYNEIFNENVDVPNWLKKSTKRQSPPHRDDAQDGEAARDTAAWIKERRAALRRCTRKPTAK